MMRIKLSVTISEVFFLPSGDSFNGYSATSSPDIANTGATLTGRVHGTDIDSAFDEEFSSLAAS